jgi:hypothetical protein
VSTVRALELQQAGQRHDLIFSRWGGGHYCHRRKNAGLTAVAGTW